MATGHTVGIQKDPEAPIIFIHVDDLKISPSPDRPAWTPEASKARSLCASTVAFRPGSHMSDSSPSVDVSSWNDLSTPTSTSDVTLSPSPTSPDRAPERPGVVIRGTPARSVSCPQRFRGSSVAHPGIPGLIRGIPAHYRLDPGCFKLFKTSGVEPGVFVSGAHP